MNHPLFTIGHSNRSLETFIELLRQAEVAIVADIRKIPRSRTNPQFNQQTLPAALEPFHISYHYLPALGGRRTRSREVSPHVNGFWTNQSFHNYADYALSPQFAAGLDELLALGQQQRCAMMCSEAVWWRCHRRIVTDHLLARGQTVVHIMEQKRLEPARLTAGALVQSDGTVVYPAAS